MKILNIFKKNKKTLFLDIDRVLNYSDEIEIINNIYYPKIETELISLLNELTEYEIVLSSSWRTQLTIKEIKFLFKYKKIKLDFINITNKDLSKELSIKEYILKNDIKNYLILEDDLEALKHFKENEYIHIKNSLTKEDIKEIRAKKF